MRANSHSKAGGRKIKFRGSTSPIGLDIGTAEIKLLQLQQKASNLTVLCRAVIPTPVGAFSEGRISDPEKLTFKLEQLKNKMKLKGNLVNLCLGPEAHYLRLIELPSLSKKDLRKMLPWEIEKHFHLKAGKAVYDCCPLAKAKASGNGSIKYLLTAAEAETAAGLTGTAEKAGFKPLSLEVTAVSLLRLEALGQTGNLKDANSSTVLLNIGYRSSTLLLTGKGMLQYCRHLRIGVLDFIKEVSLVSDRNSSEAQRFIFQNDALAAVSTLKSAELLAEQINGSISYYLDQSGAAGAEPHLLAVSGGGASILGLLDYLQNRLSIKVELQQLPAFSGRGTGSRAKEPHLNPAIYATACGLALRGWVR